MLIQMGIIYQKRTFDMSFIYDRCKLGVYCVSSFDIKCDDIPTKFNTYSDGAMIIIEKYPDGRLIITKSLNGVISIIEK